MMASNLIEKHVSHEEAEDTWIVPLINQLDSIIRDRISCGGVCHVMLTGGRSARRLYRAWAANNDYAMILPGVQVYFGDERAVSAEDLESNYRLAVTNLFPSGIPEGVQVYRMEADDQDVNGAAERYEKVLSERMDVLLLSMGEDGHVASLFPGSDALYQTKRNVVPVVGPKPPCQRLTITPPVLKKARNLFVIALGEQKYALYEKAKTNPEKFDEIPARLVLDRNWVFGE